MGHVSRSTGRSSVQSAAYITGSSLYETRRDIAANYENRSSDIVWSQTIAPEWSPLKYHELSVWDKIESFEDEYAIERFPKSLEYREKYMDSARVAMTVVVALPRELSSDVSIELVKEFIDSRYTSQGLIVTAAMHDDEGNPHAHIQVSRRCVNEDGSFSWAKNRTICTKKELIATRKSWADLTNRFLEREGFEARITEKSFADLGVNLIPSQHRGWISDKLAAMGVQSRIVSENEQIFKSNRERILENPELILNEITSKQATFTQLDMLKTIQKRMGDDSECVGKVFEQALSKAVVLGDGIDGITRYTSAHYKAREDQALVHLDDIIGVGRDVKSSHSVSSIRVDAYLSDKFPHMSAEQHSATLGLIQDNQFAVLIGRAGTGKTTTTMKATADIYKMCGYTVLGTSLSALASENLGLETNITSKTIASWLSSWDRLAEAEEKFLAFDSVVNEGVLKQFEWYNDLMRLSGLKLTAKSVLIVDEAGMIGTESWNRLLAHATKAGAKVIAVGDDHQYKAIEAGDFFRELKDKAQQHHRLFTLNTIWRQRVDWMRQASHCFAELTIQEGLSRYEHNGRIHQTDKAHLEVDIAKAYIEKLKDEQPGLVLAFSNAQVDAINTAIRSELRWKMVKEHTLSDKDVLFIDSQQREPETNKPIQKGFAIGDKIVFLKNDKHIISIVDKYGECLPNQSIKNGTIGFLEKVSASGDVVVRLGLKGDGESDLRAQFNIKDYSHINHGYALTTHKSQGQTVDFTLVAASKAMDAKSLYVSMTRHRDDAQLFYCREDFADFKALSLHMSRFQNKDLAKDYTIRPENTDAWQRVQDYQHCVYDAAAILKELHAEEDTDLTPYLTIKKDQIALGREILMNYDAHKLYLNQASITEEMIHISTGSKSRPLSIAEERAKMTVELYGEAAQLSKELWHTVRATTPSHNHPDYAKFQEVRLDRDDLAKRILDNYPLHREFVKLYAQEYFISKRTMEGQVAYREKMEAKQNDRVKSPIQNQKIEFTFNNPSKEITPPIQETMDSIKHLFSIPDDIHQGDQTSESSPTRNYPITKKSYQKPTFEKTAIEIRQELTQNVADIAVHFLGQPKQKTSREWRYGSKGSISIHVQGHKKGLYCNFESGVSGNVMKLIEDQLGVDHKEAFKWGVNFLGYGLKTSDNHSLIAQKLQQTPLQLEPVTESHTEQSWTPIYPAPEAYPDLRNTPQLRSMMKGRSEVSRFSYKDADEHVLGYVVRLEDKKGNKITPTLTYCVNEKGEQQWRWKGFGNDRPLYGLEQLKQKPNAPVLVVEGEKTCEAARTLFPDHAVVTWSGGCGSVQKSDWSVLSEREVTIWPDHDKAGVNAALKIGKILEEHGNKNVACVDLPSTLPHKWDLADAIPTGVKIDALLEKAPTHQRFSNIIEEQRSPRYLKTFTYEEIRECAQKNNNAYLISEDNAPFMEHIANETCKEIREWSQITGKNISDEKMQLQAALTSIYTVRTKELLDQEKDPHALNKALMIGIIAGKMRMTSKLKDDYALIRQATGVYKDTEDKIQQQMLLPSHLLKNSSPIIREEIIRIAHRCNFITGKPLSAEPLGEFITGLEKTIHNDTSHRHVVGMINRMRELKSKTNTPITPDLLHGAIDIQKHHDQELIKSIQMSKDKSLHMEHQLQLQREKGLGLSL